MLLVVYLYGWRYTFSDRIDTEKKKKKREGKFIYIFIIYFPLETLYIVSNYYMDFKICFHRDFSNFYQMFCMSLHKVSY